MMEMPRYVRCAIADLNLCNGVNVKLIKEKELNDIDYGRQ